MTYSIIQKSQLEGANRLDAEYYQPEYLDYSSSLGRFPLVQLSEVCLVTDGNHSTISEQFTDSGTRYLRGKDLQDFFISDSDPVYIPENIYEKLKRSHIFQDDVLVSIVGTIGLVSIVAGTYDRLTGNCKIAILHPKGINPWFLSVFLVSKYGRYQLERMTGGAVQTGVILRDLATLKIPKISDHKQDEIAQIIKIAYEQQLSSKKLYKEAEDLLLKELGLKDFKPEDKLWYIINSSEVESARRADAEYFQPKYEKLILKIKKHKSVPFLEIIENVPANFNPKAQPEKSFQYAELANIDSSIGIIDGFSIFLGSEVPSRAKRVLKTGDVIISSVEGSLGKVALVSKEQERYLASTGFFQLRSKKILPEALLILSKSLVLQMQLEKQCAGTILTAVPKNAIENILIPLLSKSAQQKIAGLVKKSHQSRKKSKKLLEEAKWKVETMIGRGGNQSYSGNNQD